MDNDNQEQINKEGFDDFEIIENQDNHLPQNSILLMRKIMRMKKFFKV